MQCTQHQAYPIDCIATHSFSLLSILIIFDAAACPTPLVIVLALKAMSHKPLLASSLLRRLLSYMMLCRLLSMLVPPLFIQDMASYQRMQALPNCAMRMESSLLAHPHQPSPQWVSFRTSSLFNIHHALYSMLHFANCSHVVQSYTYCKSFRPYRGLFAAAKCPTSRHRVQHVYMHACIHSLYTCMM